MKAEVNIRHFAMVHEVGQGAIEGDLYVPDDAEAVVIFSHGSGSSRFSPRNRHVAAQLQDNRYATLLVDLLSEKEDETYGNRFEIGLLTERLLMVTSWVRDFEGLPDLPIGYFGASTGAASTIRAAAKRPEWISAVVSRGGRPDLAGEALDQIKAPSLLIVGGLDLGVTNLNRTAYDRMKCEKDLLFIHGATHLFEEPGKMDEVSKAAQEWFDRYLK